MTDDMRDDDRADDAEATAEAEAWDDLMGAAELAAWEAADERRAEVERAFYDEIRGDDEIPF